MHLFEMRKDNKGIFHLLVSLLKCSQRLVTNSKKAEGNLSHVAIGIQELT